MSTKFWPNRRYDFCVIAPDDRYSAIRLRKIESGLPNESWAAILGSICISTTRSVCEPQSMGRSGGAGTRGSGCKMPMFMSVLYEWSWVDRGFDAMLDSNLEFRIAESWAWIAKSEFSGSIGNSCIEGRCSAYATKICYLTLKCFSTVP